MFGSLIVGCGGSESSSISTDQPGGTNSKTVTLLNVSYDPTREFYQEFNASFADYWKGQHQSEVRIEQSHGGSGKQARAVIDGLEADVVTLALAIDIDAIAEKSKLLPLDWQQRLEFNSSPYTSTIVFLVRKGNPKGIHDWDDLLKGDVSIITPNPKTSGGARWNYLAAWGHAILNQTGSLDAFQKLPPADQQKLHDQGKAFVTQLFQRVPVLDSGARGSTNTFIQREMGDVLLTWENEAFLAMKDAGTDKVEMVVPKRSILAEPPVAVIEEVAKKHGTLEVARAYLQYLYSPAGQQLAAKHFFRPARTDLLSDEQRQPFAKVELFRLNELFGGWSEVQKTHFDDGGLFDQIYQPK